MTASEQPIDAALPEAGELVFVGFNSRVAALDRQTGELVWSWKCPRGSGIAALLVDDDRLIVSVQGYTYCLDPASGGEIWSNPLKGMGVGTACLASTRGNTTAQLHAILAEFEAQQEAAAHSATHTTT
jgi:outer membrane protein assembly factor BamB